MTRIPIVLMMLLVTVNTAWTQSSHADNEKLLIELKSENQTEHFEAAILLAKVGRAVIPELVEILRNDRWYLQLTVIWILGEIGDEAVVEPLIEMLQSEKRIGPELYMFYVGNMLYEPQREFSLFESPNAFPQRNIMFHRRAAAISLGKLGDTRAINPLKEILNKGTFHDEPEANVPVAKSLKMLSGEILPSHIEKELIQWESIYK
jgi:HEAT repeat protein